MDARSEREIAEVLAVAQAVRGAVHEVIEGKPEAVDLAITALLAEGHLLIEDVPGVGKTMLAKSLARAIDCSVRRVQFTPDLLPSDITGVSVYNQGTGDFEFKPGGVFANLVIGDEINRASPKTQSALLEAMEERRVTVDGTTHTLPRPFLVLATQNPLEQEGTYPLPEAQQDRFIMKVIVGYPTREEEQLIIRQNVQGLELPPIKPVVSLSEIHTARELVRQVYMDEKIEQYIIDIVFATRFPEQYGLANFKPLIVYGGSPRASINLALAAKAQAYLNQRGFVIPEDIRGIAKDVLRHRIGLSYEAEAENVQVENIIDELLRTIPVP